MFFDIAKCINIFMTQVNEDNNNDITPEVKAQFSSFIEPFFSKYHRERCYPGLILRHGKRTMLQINIPAGDFPSLLVIKPATENDPDSGRQRPEVPGHADDIKNPDEYVDKIFMNKNTTCPVFPLTSDFYRRSLLTREPGGNL